MYHPWLELILFVVKSIVVVMAIIAVLSTFFSLLARGKGKSKEKIQVKKLNCYYQQLTEQLEQQVMSKSAFKKHKKKQAKAAKKQADKPTIYVLNFNGDLKASAVEHFREQVTMVLTIANEKDQVFVRLESPGGMVNAYGLAASQLQRIRERNIPLTISVDKVAASGGYMMACVANKIIAAPFAIIGSIGVIAQVPNFHRLLKKHEIDFEQITAGKYKRTLTMFGENTAADREKMQQEIGDIHQLFADFVQRNRPQVEIEQVATGEYWLAEHAKALKLIDEMMTSDDFLLNAAAKHTIISLSTKQKQSLIGRLMGQAQSGIEQLNTWQWVK